MGQVLLVADGTLSVYQLDASHTQNEHPQSVVCIIILRKDTLHEKYTSENRYNQDLPTVTAPADIFAIC